MRPVKPESSFHCSPQLRVKMELLTVSILEDHFRAREMAQLVRQDDLGLGLHC